MEYKQQKPQNARVTPRLIIHGGAGNITPANLPPERYEAYREALLTILCKTHSYMHTPQADPGAPTAATRLPTALESATHAVALLEDDALFNSGHGAVFTRDGTNELEASVMVSRGRAKRAVGVMGLRRVRNPVRLARALLERGDADLAAPPPSDSASPAAAAATGLDVPSAQGHCQVHGAAAEALARRYGLDMVDPAYFFTRRRWDEHVRGLARERRGAGAGAGAGATASWSADEYLPQGTCGAVALDADGMVCCATSTGGLTNKLSGRIGDTPTVGAGFWAEEWAEDGDPTGLAAGVEDAWDGARQALGRQTAVVEVSASLRGLLADCFPSPLRYRPLGATRPATRELTTTRSIAASGTGNGDSFIRVNAVRTVAAIARWQPVSSAVALTRVTGPDGELQKSAGDRWHKTGEGEGGMIGIESVVVKDSHGNIVDTRSEILHDHNCGGMFRAWINGDGKAHMQVFRERVDVFERHVAYGEGEDVRLWAGEKYAY